MVSLELYVKQEAVSTRFDSKYQRDKPGGGICAFDRETGQYARREYVRPACTPIYSAFSNSMVSPM